MPHRCDRVGNGNRALGHVGVQTLHHAAVELDRAARGVFGPLEGRDDLARFGDFLGRRREDRVAGLDMARMDQRLAVEAEVTALRAFGCKTIDVGDVAIGSVENFQPVRARLV